MYSPSEEPKSRESTEDRDWSEESQTFYYSSFELFDTNEDISKFYQYSLFVDQILLELGEEWKAEAQVLYSPHFTGQQIFMTLLSMWLHHHPIVNNIQFSMESNKSSPTFSQNYVEDFNNRILQQLDMKGVKNCQSFKVKSTSAKAVCMGFFMTANQIWGEMFQKKIQEDKKGFSIFKGVSRTIEQSFQPLMVVTEKITNLFGKKKVKKEQEIEIDMQKQDNQKVIADCFKEFRKTVDIEQQLIRKMNDFSLLDEEDQKKQYEQKKKVTKHEFKQDQAPVQKNALGKIYSCLTKYLKNQPWQVANNFVTNILEINEIHAENGAKVKVLKPAEDFYEKLIVFWITLKNKQKREISFEQYKENVKSSLGFAWRQKLIIPVKYFYEKLSSCWEQIIQSAGELKVQDKLLMDTLIRKIRQKMRNDWQQKIKIERRKKNLRKN